MGTCFEYIISLRNAHFSGLTNALYFSKKKIKKHFFFFTYMGHFEPVWYVCLKTENCCLKTFVEIRVGEKVS